MDFYKVCNCDTAMENMEITAKNILKMDKYSISRTDLDKFAMESQQKACTAIEMGKLKSLNPFFEHNILDFIISIFNYNVSFYERL
jgi:acetyl-CoA acetyltransferase